MSEPRRQPPQVVPPDDLVPNRTGYSNDQLAIRMLVEVVAELVMYGSAPDTTRWVMHEKLADVLRQTEPS